MRYIKDIQSEIAENKYLSEAIQDPFIQLRIQSSLEWYIRKAQKNKHYFYIFSMITIICPILSGVVNLIEVNEQLRIFSSGIMGCSSVTAAFLNLFNVNKKWMLYRNQAEGIKRMVSLLNYLISLYNNPSICLAVDELDAGVFEYLLGELVGVLAEEAKGQLIFTSHNLRIMEKLDKKNIICSTINPKNRYISLKGIEKTNNRRDFYIRAVVLGGQKERLYDDTELQDIGYAFQKAGNPEGNDVEIDFSAEFLELLKNG